MYSWEIDNLIQRNNGELSLDEFLNVYDNSPQMTGCLYEDNNPFPYCFWLDNYKDLYFKIKELEGDNYV